MIKKQKGITLVALVITIIILLLLAGITISSLGGEDGLLEKVKQSKKTSIKAEIKESLVLVLTELQVEKVAGAKLDDITQEYLSSKLPEYEVTVETDTATNGKIVTVIKDGVIGKFLIDDKLNITEIDEAGTYVTYKTISVNTDGTVNIKITVTSSEGIKEIIKPDGSIQSGNGEGKIEINSIINFETDYTVKVKTEESEKEQTIRVDDFYYNVDKSGLAEGIGTTNETLAGYKTGYKATITIGNEYILETLEVTMGGTAITDETVVNKTTGEINITSAIGDIVITATAKKLQIETTEAFVNSSQGATSSLEANTVDKGTTSKLYVSFAATIEGQNCTIEPALSEGVTSNGTYTFTITGTYQGKTIQTTKEVIVNQFMSAKNLVQYDAGTWTQEEITALGSLYNLNESKTASADLSFTFGSFTAGTDRNGSVDPSEGIVKYSGWQIFEIKDEEGNIIKTETEINNKLKNINSERIYVTKIVHAGSPENFTFYYNDEGDEYRAQYILSNKTDETNYNTYKNGETIIPRNWDIYKDQKQLELIKNVHIMSYEEAFERTPVLYQNTEQLSMGGCYFLDKAYVALVSHNLWFVDYYGAMHSAQNRCMGIRPVIEMNDGVYISSGNGTLDNEYVLALEQ